MSFAFSQRCLICSSRSPKSTSTSFLSGEESDESRVSSMLDRQMSALYLVSGLLEVPGEMCARFLTVYGHPEQWVKVCDWCDILVAQGMTLFRQIKRLEAEHAKVRAAVRDRMKVKVEVEGPGDDEEAAAIDIRRFLDAIDNLETEHRTDSQCNLQDENTRNYIRSQAVSTANETPHKRSNKSSTPPRCTAKVTKSILKSVAKPSESCPDSSTENTNFSSPSNNDHSRPGIISAAKGCATAKFKKKPKRTTKSYIKPKDFDSSGDADTPSTNHGARRSGRQVTKKVQYGDDIKSEDHQSILEGTDVQHYVIEEEQDFDLDTEEIDHQSDPDWDSEDLSCSFKKNIATFEANTEMERDIIFNDSSLSNNSNDNLHEPDYAPSTSNKNTKLEKSGRKYSYTSNKLMDNGRLKPEFRKYPIRETLTFQQVIELQKKTALPPVLGRITKEERKNRRLLQKGNSLAALCRRHRVKEFPCATCGHVFSMYKDWNLHANINECEKSNDTLRKFGPVVIERMKCEQCGKPVGSATALEDHHRTAHDGSELMLNCKGCSAVFRQAGDYQKHYFDLLESNPDSDCVKFALKCPYKDGCRTAIRNSDEALRLHIRIRHINPIPRTHLCIQCNKSFSSKYLLRRHVELHAPRDFKCDRLNCTSKFSTKIRLRNHIKHVHESKKDGAKEYPCSICHKIFYVKAQTTRHEKIHNPESPFLCTVCGKRFKLANYLTIHMWSHDPAMKARYVRYKHAAEQRRQQKEDLLNHETDHASEMQQDVTHHLPNDFI